LTLRGVLLGSLLWPFRQDAAGFVAAAAVFATATGRDGIVAISKIGGEDATVACDRRGRSTPVLHGRDRLSGS
jgi:hypothetical protein